MKTKRVIIIGAGLSGLYSAYLLKRQGIEATILESRGRVGGRILTAKTEERGEKEYYDLGPSWFWPGMNRRVESLVKTFGLNVFAQQEEGNYLMEDTKTSPPRVIPGIYVNSPSSYRVEGGMNSLVNAVYKELKEEQIVLNTQVTRITKHDGGYTVHAETDGESTVYEGDYVISAIPLRLLVNQVGFSPELPESLLKVMLNTPTWMAAHAKFVAVYDRPFWRDEGHSGTASSRVGPLVEIHDASINSQSGAGALFGFIGYNAQTRKTAGREKLKELAIEQLSHIFGEKASKPIRVELVDWSQEEYTATVDDQVQTMHGSYGLPSEPVEQLAAQGLYFAGTEAAKGYGGYIEGAWRLQKSLYLS
ncbi:flavin monoamine oxidase family protein [Veronia nyctiphanis]|uniref:flavin monoamine oxidase family protein n=1 Tax=Veronia nyctiphanis TaxID=1278244 RepID=UPI00191C07F8|nr:FAD-dependent oxidoreductase [Veronia nyctiphanis]